MLLHSWLYMLHLYFSASTQTVAPFMNRSCVLSCLLGSAFLCITFLSNSATAQSSIDLSDVGEVALENTGAREAQQAFLHGLAQLHNFEYGFAAEDFREAQSIDPDFALAYWGEAMTYNHPIWMQQDRNAALAALNKYAPSPEARQAKAPT